MGINNRHTYPGIGEENRLGFEPAPLDFKKYYWNGVCFNRADLVIASYLDFSEKFLDKNGQTYYVTFRINKNAAGEIISILNTGISGTKPSYYP